MKEAGISDQQTFVTDHEAPLPTQPGKGSFNDPAFPVPPHRASILMSGFFVIPPGRNDRFNSPSGKTLTQRVAIITPVSDQPIRLLSRASGMMLARHRHGVQRLLYKRHLRRGCRVQVCSQRSTLAIDQNHPLRPLSPLGFPDSGPPFLAGAKLPSIKHSLHWILSRSESSDKRARHNFSKTPDSSHSFKRRQQVLELPYFCGSSLQGAPVHKTQRIPSKHRRSSARGRPPIGETDFLGSHGSIFAHWASDKSDLAML